MKIGITERGDAGITNEWQDNLSRVDGAILITKNITKMFHDFVLIQKDKYPLIIHATITGWGGSIVEPNVPNYKQELQALCSLIQEGFPIKNCVLRIDPIIPNEAGLKAVTNVLNAYLSISELKGIRIRISLLDEYKHVKERINKIGYSSFYSNYRFQPTQQEINKVITILEPYYIEHQIKFETCAENKLIHPMFIHQGCVSNKDIEIMGLSTQEKLYINPQQRNGCLCLSCKTELLNYKHPCKHKCLYCYWKN